MLNQRGKRNYKAGLFAELLARIYLRFKFYNILKIRYKTSFGEIDIIASKGNCIIFIEVKQKKISDFRDVISKRQMENIIRSAKYFLNSNSKYNSKNIRFDAIFVTIPNKISHIKNAWIEE